MLAATLSPSYGIYSGFEHCENVPVRPGSEEYLNSEKYELKQRKLDGPLLPLVATAQRGAAREPGAAVARSAHDPRDRERAALRLPQAARRQHRRHRRQPRPGGDAGRRLRRAGLDRAAAGLPGARPPLGREVDVADRPQLRQARPGQSHVLRIGGEMTVPRPRPVSDTGRVRRSCAGGQSPHALEPFGQPCPRACLGV